MSRLFADDGSVTPNIRTQIYGVTIIPDRKHTTIVGGLVYVRGTSEAQVRSKVEAWLPMITVACVSPIDRAQSEPGERSSEQAQPTRAGRPASR